MNNNITIKNISLINFKSHRNLNIDFDDLNILIGENGAGKTSVLEAICYGLFGTVASGVKKNELVRYGEKSGGVTITFSNNYKIVRDFSTTIKLLDNNNKVISERAMDIESYLNIDKNIFMNILYAGQNDIYTYFMKFNAKEKDFIDNIFNLSDLTENISNQLKSCISEYTSLINEIKNKKALKTQLINNIQNTLNKYNISTINELSRAVEISKENLNNILSIQSSINEKNNYIIQQKQYESLLKNTQDNISIIEKKCNDYNKIIEDSRNNLIAYFNECVKSTNPGLNININDIDKYFNLLDQNLNVGNYLLMIKQLINSSIDQQDNKQIVIENLNNIYRIIETIENIDLYRKYYNEIKINLNNLKNNYSNIVIQFNNDKSNLQKFKDNIIQIENNLNNINNKLKEFNDIKDNNEYTQLAIQYQSTFTQYNTVYNNIILQQNQIDSIEYDDSLIDKYEKNIESINNILKLFNRDGFTSYLRKSLLKEIGNNIGQSLDKFGFTKLIPVTIDEKNGALLFHNRLFRSLSGGEKTIVGILLRVLYARLLAPTMRLNVLILDEPTADLDSVRVGYLRNLLYKIKEVLKMQIIVVTHDETVIPEECNVININLINNVL